MTDTPAITPAAALNAAAEQIIASLGLTETDKLSFSTDTALVVFDGGLLLGEVEMDYADNDGYTQCNVMLAGEHISTERYDTHTQKFSEYEEMLRGARYYTA